MSVAIQGLSEIIDRFQAVIVDQYGVLHDGQTAFPGARAALDQVAAQGRPIVALTNSGKRAAANADRLARFGFPHRLFRAVISSGEVARDLMTQGPFAPMTRVLLLTRDEDDTVLDGLGKDPVAPGAPADMILLAGVAPERTEQADYAALLKPYAARQVPLLCANPDTIMGTALGPRFGAGAVAEDYAKMGGAVTHIGKPARAIFDAALRSTGALDPASVLMIGDSPAHDIAGAQAAGMGTLLVTSGVQSALAGAEPDFIAPSLAW